MASSEPRKIVGLDIGTSKVAVIVGEVAEDGGLDIIGVGNQPSRGMKKGMVVDIEATVDTIGRAVAEAESDSGCDIRSVYAGIAGSHIRGLNSIGVVGLRDGEVYPHDVQQVLEAARAVAIPADQEVLHALPQEYQVDNQDGVRQPVGMSGVRLEVKVHLVTCAANAVLNLKRCIERCDLHVEDVILEQLASSYSTLTDDERNLGVCLVDIGGGTTDIAVFTDGAIRHTAVVPIAGDQVTNDIAMALRTPTQHANDIKIGYGCALAQLADPDAIIQVPGAGNRPSRELSQQTLAEVVEPRYEELFKWVQENLARSGYADRVASGIVLTGGSAKMQGVAELAEEIFHLPVCLASPRGVGGATDVVANPIYATGVGLAMYGKEQGAAGRGRPRPAQQVRGVLTRVRQWLASNM